MGKVVDQTVGPTTPFLRSLRKLCWSEQLRSTMASSGIFGKQPSISQVACAGMPIVRRVWHLLSKVGARTKGLNKCHPASTMTTHDVEKKPLVAHRLEQVCMYDH